MSIKVLAIGDPHFKTSNVVECNLMISGIIQTIEMTNIDFIVVLGDILHTHEIINVYPFVRSIKFFEKLKDKAPLYILIGNHDRPNNADFLSDYSPYYGLKYMPNTYIVDKPLLHNIKGNNFIFVPYVPNGRFKEAILQIDTINANLENICMIFAHQEFKGSKMGAIISEKGDKWPINYPPVITGHIHDYSKPQTNILYTGTPFQHGFGDTLQKTISLITILTDKKNYNIYNNETITSDNDSITNDSGIDTNNDATIIDQINNPLINNSNIKETNWIEQKIDLHLPKKITFKLKVPDIIGFNTSMLNMRNKYRIIIEGTQGEIDSCKKLRDIKNIENMGIKIKYKVLKDDSNVETLSNNKIVKLLIQNSTFMLQNNQRYILQLHNVIEKDSGMIYWYDKLFTNIK